MTHPSLHLVLLPGLDGTGELFAPLLAALLRQLPVTVLRYPDDPHLDIEQLADGVVAQLPDAPLTLLAESFSGLVAAELLRRGEPRLRGLILTASFMQPPRP